MRVVLLVDEVQSAIAGYDEAARLPEIVEQLRKSGLSVSVSMVSNILEGGATPSDDTPVLSSFRRGAAAGIWPGELWVAASTGAFVPV